jgi:hypothetical protein
MAKGQRIQTDAGQVDWPRLEVEVVQKVRLLRAAWECSQREAPPKVHAKLVRDLYVPCVSLLAKFCASVEEKDA